MDIEWFVTWPRRARNVHYSNTLLPLIMAEAALAR